MGLFLYTFLFPGGEEASCRAAFLQEAEDLDLNIHPKDCFWHVFEKGPAVLLDEGAMGFESAGRLSETVDCPVMGLYIYDDDFWGYDLWEKGRQVDEFASVHDYFDEDSPPNKPGNAEAVARCFGVPHERFDRYLIPWEEETMDQYAYECDEAPMGDSWQMTDFMMALGFDYDLLCPPEAGETPEKEPNRPAATVTDAPSPASPCAGKGRKAEDTPELPSALTSRDYVFRRLEMLGEEYQALQPLLQYAKYQEAVSLLAEAIQAHPEEAGFYLLRTFCWKQLEGRSSRSRVPDMLRDLTRALELEPDNVMALRGRSSLTTTSRRYPQQIDDLTRLIRLDGENRDLYLVSRAYFHHWLKDDIAARADLEDVLRRGELWTVDLVYLCRELNLPGF